MYVISILKKYFFFRVKCRSKCQNCARKKKCYGVTKWMLENLDDIDLLYQIGVLSNCYEMKNILMNRWDEIRYINFFDAMKILKQNKELFSDDFFISYWEKMSKKLRFD